MKKLLIITIISILSTLTIMAKTVKTDITFIENSTHYATYEGYTNNTTIFKEDLKIELLYPSNNIDFTIETNHTGSGIFTVYYKGTVKIKDNNNNEKFVFLQKIF